jgi:hypothetical protein
MLCRAAADMQTAVDAWQSNPALYPQIITWSDLRSHPSGRKLPSLYGY